MVIEGDFHGFALTGLEADFREATQFLGRTVDNTLEVGPGIDLHYFGAGTLAAGTKQTDGLCPGRSPGRKADNHQEHIKNCTDEFVRLHSFFIIALQS